MTLTREPLNAETRLDLQDGPITPAPRHYVRSHFALPDPPRAISVAGAVAAPRSLSIRDLRALPRRSAVVTLECAGNGRAFLDPPAPGEQWRLGAVSTAEWTGAALRSVLEPAGLFSSTVEILFRGADAGSPPDGRARIFFERSLPLSRALADDVLVAYAMNGDEMPSEHGAPARLIVPAWYGMASVKWLAEIVALERPFRGFYQADRYVVGDEPVRGVKPRAVIVSPQAAVRSPATVRGFAWSGQGSIVSVDLSVDGGRTWRGATLGPQPSPVAWCEWQAGLALSAGTYDLVARATDASGEQQPLENRANPLGYMNNAAQPVRVDVR